MLARVTLWTDWGIPTFGFTLYLRSNDVQTINLRDLFATGNVPATGPGADLFPGCNASLGGFQVIAPVLLQTAHTGQNTTTNLGQTSIFDLATQRMDITAVPQPYTFDFLEMNLNLGDNTPAQAWVGVEASASGQFSVGFAASPTNDMCAIAP